MGPAGRMFYVGSLGCFLLIAAVSALAGIWIWTIAALILGAAFAVSGPFVAGRRWRPEPPKARARPVARRRR